MICSEHSSLYFKVDNLTNQNPGNANPVHASQPELEHQRESV